MICMLDIFKNCLILRHRRSHDITAPSSKGLFNLTRSSSTTSIISCTKKQDDLPPLGTLPRIPATESNRSSDHTATWPASFISSPQNRISTTLPVRPNSIAGLPSISEQPPVTEPSTEVDNAVTIIEVNGSRPIEEPQYSEPFDNERKEAESESNQSADSLEEDYPYQDIYEEIRHRDQRDDDLPDVVTSAYASGEQVYQELLDLVKEEEIKEEKRRSQFLSIESGGSVSTLERSDEGSDCSEDKKNSLEDLYAVPKRNKTEGPRLPPRRVKSNYSRDPNWAPKVPEKSSLLRRSLSDAAGPKDEALSKTKSQQSLSVIPDAPSDINCDIYEELHVRRDRLI